jgi:hypothetical protein
MAGPSTSKKRSSDARRRHAAWLFASLSAVFLFSALVPADILARLPSSCLWHQAGLNCWACGLSRGVCELSHGHWDAALAHNRLSPWVYALLLGLWLQSAWRLLRHPKD